MKALIKIHMSTQPQVRGQLLVLLKIPLLLAIITISERKMSLELKNGHECIIHGIQVKNIIYKNIHNFG